MSIHNICAEAILMSTYNKSFYGEKHMLWVLIKINEYPQHMFLWRTIDSCLLIGPAHPCSLARTSAARS